MLPPGLMKYPIWCARMLLTRRKRCWRRWTRRSGRASSSWRSWTAAPTQSSAAQLSSTGCRWRSMSSSRTRSLCCRLSRVLWRTSGASRRRSPRNTRANSLRRSWISERRSGSPPTKRGSTLLWKKWNRWPTSATPCGTSRRRRKMTST